MDGDLIIYYEKGDPTKRVMPDVVVAFGVGHRRRMSYRVWDEGKARAYAAKTETRVAELEAQLCALQAQQGPRDGRD